MIKTLNAIFTAAALIAIGFFAHLMFDAPKLGGGGDPVTHRSSQGPTIEQVRKLSQLVTLHVPISDVQVSELDGLTGGLRLALAVHGDVQIGTDLSHARFEDVNDERRTALLVLPKPRPQRPRLDHEKTRIVELQRGGAWRFVGGQAGERELTNRAMLAAQQTLEQAANRRDLAAQACEQTEQIIRQFYSATGWDITLQWE